MARKREGFWTSDLLAALRAVLVTVVAVHVLVVAIIGVAMLLWLR